MATLMRLFDRYADTRAAAGDSGDTGDAVISSAADWDAWARDLDGYGLATPRRAFTTLLARVWAEAAADAGAAIAASGAGAAADASGHRRRQPPQHQHGAEPRVAYSTFVRAAAETLAYAPGAPSDADAAAAVQDVTQDMTALRRFSEYILTRYGAGSPSGVALLGGLERVAAAYRAALLKLLRLATAEAAAIDAAQTRRLLRAGLASDAAVHGSDPSPFAFQRTKAHALAVRAATVHVRARNIVRRHRLYSPAPRSGDAVPPPRLTSIASYYATRSDTAAEDAANAAVPFELEVVRLPVCAALDVVAAASASHAAYDAGAAALLPGLTGGSSESGTAPGLVSGGIAVPAPSLSAAQPRLHATTIRGMYSEYAALNELLLSPYFPDVCGVHEADDGAAAAIVGPSQLFVYEHVPGMIPLAQLVERCGRLPEASPLFRHIASELIRALADIEMQCTHALVGPHAGLSLDTLYISEQGTRVTLRGLPWSEPMIADADDSSDAVQQRSRALLRGFGAVLRALLVPPRRGAARHGAEAETAPATARSEMRTLDNGASGARSFSQARAELGIAVCEDELFDVLLPLPGGDAASDAAIWSEPVMKMKLGAARGGGGSEEIVSCVNPQSRAPAGAVTGRTLDGASVATTPLLVQVARTDEVHLADGRVVDAAARPSADGNRYTRITFRATRPGTAILWAVLHNPSARQPATLLAPVRVYSTAPSPTLNAILDAVDPQAEASAPMATLRLLSAFSDVTGASSALRTSRLEISKHAAGGEAGADARDDDDLDVVDGEEGGHDGASSSSSADTGFQVTRTRGKQRAPGFGASVYRVARQLAAIFRIGSYAGGGAAAAADVPEADSASLHAIHGDNLDADTSAGDADNLAAVLELLQPDAALVAEASANLTDEADREGDNGDGGRPAVLRWVSTLAKHPYFAPLPLDAAAAQSQPHPHPQSSTCEFDDTGIDTELTQQGVIDAFISFAAPLLGSAGVAAPAAGADAAVMRRDAGAAGSAGSVGAALLPASPE